LPHAWHWPLEHKSPFEQGWPLVMHVPGVPPLVSQHPPAWQAMPVVQQAVPEVPHGPASDGASGGASNSASPALSPGASDATSASTSDGASTVESRPPSLPIVTSPPASACTPVSAIVPSFELGASCTVPSFCPPASSPVYVCSNTLKSFVQAVKKSAQ